MHTLIAIPAFNEERILEQSITRLVQFCREQLLEPWQVVVADNGSTDGTALVAQQLAQKYPEVRHIVVVKKGKGVAIKTAWQSSDALVYCFMDADLATDLVALPLALAAIKNGADLAIGNRFDLRSKVSRSMARKLFSRGYRYALRLLLNTRVADAPCGFKVVTRRVINEVLPAVVDSGWFFDSELVILAEKKGFKVAEVPVVWHDPREGTDRSRVHALSLAVEYLKKIIELRRRV